MRRHLDQRFKPVELVWKSSEVEQYCKPKHSKSRFFFYFKYQNSFYRRYFRTRKVLVCSKPKLYTITPSKWILEGDSCRQGGDELCNWCGEENKACEEGGESEKMWRGGGVGSGRKTPPRCLRFAFARWRLPFALVFMLLYRITCVVYFQKGFYNV